MSADDPRYRMWAEACELIDRAERLRRLFFEPAVAGMASASWQPPIDVYETEREIRIEAAMPGVGAASLEVRLDGDTLVVSGSRALPGDMRRALIRRLEIPHGSFERRIPLSGTQLRIERRELVDGCLTISLLKTLRVERSR